MRPRGRVHWQIASRPCVSGAASWPRRRITAMPFSRGAEKRRSKERRRAERRSSARYSSGVVLVVDGITWIDDEGSDRRRKVRRRKDRERLAKEILENS